MTRSLSVPRDGEGSDSDPSEENKELEYVILSAAREGAQNGEKHVSSKEDR